MGRIDCAPTQAADAIQAVGFRHLPVTATLDSLLRIQLRSSEVRNVADSVRPGSARRDASPGLQAGHLELVLTLRFPAIPDEIR